MCRFVQTLTHAPLFTLTEAAAATSGFLEADGVDDMDWTDEKSHSREENVKKDGVNTHARGIKTT